MVRYGSDKHIIISRFGLLPISILCSIILDAMGVGLETPLLGPLAVSVSPPIGLVLASDKLLRRFAGLNQ